MTKRTGLSITLGFLALVASAHATPACSTSTTLAALMALGSSGCQIDDKLYNNFSYNPGAGAPTASQVVANEDESLPILLTGWTFTSATGVFNGDFSLGFMVSVITSGPGSCPTCTIASATEQMLSGTTSPGPQAISVTESAGATINLNNTLVTNQTGQDIFGSGVITDTKLATVSGISNATPLVSFESDIRQASTTTPEPATLSLLGAGLVGLGLLNRRRTRV